MPQFLYSLLPWFNDGWLSGPGRFALPPLTSFSTPAPNKRQEGTFGSGGEEGTLPPLSSHSNRRGLTRALYRPDSARTAAVPHELPPDHSIHAWFRNQDSLTHSSSNCGATGKEQPCRRQSPLTPRQHAERRRAGEDTLDSALLKV